jgi:tetrahydromethanopterin S-methyltransferase subunit G
MSVATSDLNLKTHVASGYGGPSLYYIICAVVVKAEDINALEAEIEKIRSKNGFQSGEMKSSLIGDNHKRRIKILTELLGLDFSLVILIADKQKFYS